MTREKTQLTAPGSDEYDRMYESHDTTYDAPAQSQYYAMFCRAAELVQATGIRAVLEVGCGSRVLAEMIIGRRIAIRKCLFLQSRVRRMFICKLPQEMHDALSRILPDL